ncbi:hypothetical protein C2E23DRAFT_695657, partial [Lenzites betulinus]
VAAFTDHSSLDRLPNGNIILHRRPNGGRHQYTTNQLRLYSNFDYALRGDRISGPGLVVPAGYNEFWELWAQDTDCRYQFTAYDAVTGEVDLVGIHLPPDQLAPAADRPAPRMQAVARVSPAAMELSANDRLEARRRTIIDTLMLDQLERGQHIQEEIRARRERRN